jgi:hypothetical protein
VTDVQDARHVEVGLTIGSADRQQIERAERADEAHQLELVGRHLPEVVARARDVEVRAVRIDAEESVDALDQVARTVAA